MENKRELKEIIEEPKEELPQNNSEDPKEEIEEVQEQEKVHPDISNNILPLETMKEKKEKKEKEEEENITYSVSSI